MELQFNQRRRLVGASLSDYLLEKTRVTHAPANERSFHTFYYMLAGATIEERKQWNLLGDASKYAYLSPPRAPLADAEHNEAVAFAELRAALTTLGFKEKYHKEVFHLLSAILLIGNLELVEGEAKDEAAVVKNVDLLAVVAGFLGLKPIDLENAFVFKTKLIKNELCTMFLDREEALVQRDALARTLYGLLWTWVVDCLNKRLCHEQEPAAIISLVDMFGLENLKTNQLHQLLYNYTAEKMFAFTNEQLFDLRVQEYHAEGVSVTDVTYGDNTKILDLLVAKKTVGDEGGDMICSYYH